MSVHATITRRLLKKSDIWNKPLNEIRQTMAQIKGSGIPQGIIATSMQVNGVNCEVFRHADNAERSTLLYFHGGGFCLGIYEANRSFAARLAQLLNVTVYMPDYRLAPEHPYPAALEDATAVLRELSGCSRLIVMGDSSGCALALSALQKQQAMPQALVMITPVLDLSDSQMRVASSVKKDPFRLDDPLKLTKLYTSGQNVSSPDISPIFGHLENLPPTLVHAAEYDAFLSDACSFADRAKECTSDVQLKIWPKMWHIFHMQSPFVPEATRALSEIAAFIKQF